jgi:hypothetical protein
MRLMLPVISLAVVVGSLAGGRLDRLPHAGVRWAPLAVAGLALQLAPLPGRTALGLLYQSFGLPLAFAAANPRRPGFALILLGRRSQRSAGQLEALRELDCNFEQGFYLARPLDPAVATTLLEGERLREQPPQNPRR